MPSTSSPSGHRVLVNRSSRRIAGSHSAATLGVPADGAGTLPELPGYQLEAELGRGAMGVVYRARHALLRRPTAVKLLSLDKVSEAAVARFERDSLAPRSWSL